MNNLPEPTDDTSVVNIPICCIEGHEDCPHVARRDLRAKKKNIAL